MYIEHPYFVGDKYFAKVDGEFIEITKEVAYAMSNFYRSSKPRKIEVKNEKGEVVGKKNREIPFSSTGNEENDFSIEDYPDMSCCVENSVIEKIEAQKIHKVINGLSPEERMIIYAIYFEDKTQEELASIMGVSQQVVAYRLKKILNKMREIYMKNKKS